MNTDFINDFLAFFSSFIYFDYVVTAILIFVGFLLAKFVSKQMNKLCLTIFEKLKGKNNSLPVVSFAFSIQLIILGIISLFFLKIISPLAYLQEVATYILKALILIGIINFGLKCALMISFLLERKAQKTKGKFDDLLAQVIGKTLKIIVYTVGFIIGADLFGLPLNSIVTGLGIGGIAVAMAAKDTIANIFGFVTIVTDRPFNIGDWVKVQRSEGTVEKLGFRSTQIRTFYNSVISIPNSTFLNSSVDNMGLRKYRRFSTNLSLTYSSEADDIESFCEGVRELIRQHPQTRKDYFFVTLNNLSDSSLDILLYCFFEVESWDEELAARHRLLVDILRLAKQLSVNFAFPTQTLFMSKETDSSNELVSKQDILTKENSAKLMAENISTQYY